MTIQTALHSLHNGQHLLVSMEALIISVARIALLSICIIINLFIEEIYQVSFVKLASLDFIEQGGNIRVN